MHGAFLTTQSHSLEDSELVLCNQTAFLSGNSDESESELIN